MTSPSTPPPSGPDDPVLLRWRDRIRAADAAGAPLQLHGGGTKAFHGEAAVGERFDTREYRGIVAYEPTELVVTARCGTPPPSSRTAAGRRVLIACRGRRRGSSAC